MTGSAAIELDAIVPAFGDHGARHGSDDAEPDVSPALGGFEQPLADIFAEQLPRQKRMGERLMQACLVLALVELAKRPVQEIPGLTCTN